MSQSVSKKPEALRDLVEQADYIAQQSLEAAERFLDAAEATFELLARSPELGGLCQFRSPQAAGLRVWPVRGFKNHLVFYRPADNGIDVIRVIHAARDIEAVLGGEPDQ